MAPTIPTGNSAETPTADAADVGRETSGAEAVDYESPVPAEPLDEDVGPPPRGGGWTITLLCAGIARGCANSILVKVNQIGTLT